MGCGGSKLEELEAVAHCRERSRLLADAIMYRYAFADAHASYVRSLRSMGSSLDAFLHAVPSPSSPHLPLPVHRKGDPLPPLSPSPSSEHSHSHIQFRSSDLDSDDDYGDRGGGGDSHFHLHSEGEVNVSYARNQPTASSVSYEEKPKSPQPIYHYEYGYSNPAQRSNFSSASYEEKPKSSEPIYQHDYGYPYPAPRSNFNDYPYPYLSYGGNNGYYGRSSPQSDIPPPAAEEAPPPPPPSPPRTSAWDFLNPFESYDSYYADYTPSRSSKEVREEEDIPDLEEEHAAVKKVYNDEKFSPSTSVDAVKEERMSNAGEDISSGSSTISTSSSLEHDVHLVEKDVVGDEVHGKAEQRNVAPVAVTKTYHDDSEVVQEISTQFARASEAADQVSKMLEVGKKPYYQKNSAYKVSVRMICGLPPASNSVDENLLQFEEEMAMGCGNLSSTLQKLYMWEMKLLEEVKAEEKMRVLYDRKRAELKRLDERGAEAYKVEAAQTFIRKLSTRIKIAIQVVNTISNKISKLRDEELWPQICELVQGLMRMWGNMLECHRTQCQAILEAKNLDSIVSAVKLNDANMEITKQLELELLDWVTSFSAWINAQRSYVKALNGWLVKGLNYVQEVTDDGVPPFSPGRLGAPPVFVICNYWSESMDRISEMEVVNNMQSFATMVLHLWEQHKFEQRQRLMANRDMDRTLKLMEREEQLMRKALEAQNKKLVLSSSQSGVTLSAEVVNQGPTVEISSLQLSLRQIFGAMENFTAGFAKTYEGLYLRSEEEKERLARKNAKVP
ncbi:uncharacterized protein [Typha latifolia]|uniref:uncharacterized protein n=1 Tax=Typha latifolia TaxID=4733 RepID=UPI003C2E8985